MGLRFPAERNLVDARTGPFWLEVDERGLWRVEEEGRVWLPSSRPLASWLEQLCARAGCAVPWGELADRAGELAGGRP